MPPPAAGAPGGGGGGAGGVNDAFKDALQRARQVCVCVAPSNQWGPRAWRPRSRGCGNSEGAVHSAVGVGAPPLACVCWGELCPVPTPPLRHLPALGREVFVALLRRRLRTALGSARGDFGERRGPAGLFPDGGEAKSRRASSGALSGPARRRDGRAAAPRRGPCCGARGARSLLGPVGQRRGLRSQGGPCGSALSLSFICSFCTTGNVLVASRAKCSPCLLISGRGFGSI